METSIYFISNSLYRCVFSGGMNVVITGGSWLMSPEFTFLRSQSAKCDYQMEWCWTWLGAVVLASLLGLTASGGADDSVRLVLKWSLTFHSRGNTCLCSCCITHLLRLLVACHQLVRCAMQFRIQSVPLVQVIQGKVEIVFFFFLTPWVWLLWSADNLSSFSLFIDAPPPPGLVLFTQFPDKAAPLYSIRKLSFCPGCERTCSISADKQMFNF